MDKPRVSDQALDQLLLKARSFDDYTSQAVTDAELLRAESQPDVLTENLVTTTPNLSWTAASTAGSSRENSRVQGHQAPSSTSPMSTVSIA